MGRESSTSLRCVRSGGRVSPNRVPHAGLRAMIEESEIRRSPRIRTWFETHFSSQRQEGEGVLADVSYTGARVEDTGIRPSVGALAILYVCLPDDPKPFQLEGKVTRHTDAGFAIEYDKPDRDTRCGVDRIAELVGLPEASPNDSSDAAPIESAEEDCVVTRPRMEEAPRTEEVPRMEEESRVSELDLTQYEMAELEIARRANRERAEPQARRGQEAGARGDREDRRARGLQPRRGALSVCGVRPQGAGVPCGTRHSLPAPVCHDSRSVYPRSALEFDAMRSTPPRGGVDEALAASAAYRADGPRAAGPRCPRRASASRPAPGSR